MIIVWKVLLFWARKEMVEHISNIMKKLLKKVKKTKKKIFVFKLQQKDEAIKYLKDRAKSAFFKTRNWLKTFITVRI